MYNSFLFTRITMHTIIITFFITLLLLLSGCNETAGIPQDTTKTTKISYGSVEGITYVCSSGKVGTTDSNGSFYCDEIDNVTLYIGDTKLNTVLSKDTLLTPYEIFGDDNVAALNYVRLIEALDANKSDGTKTELDPDLIAQLPDNIDFSSPTFESDVERSLLLHLITLTQAQTILNEAILADGGEIPAGSHPPVAGITYTRVNTLVSLDGTTSTDADGDTLTYKWSLKAPAGSSAILSNTESITPYFTVDKSGDYTVSLTVKDGTVYSQETQVVITITPDVALPPIANAGADQNVLINNTVTLDATQSSLEGGDALSYAWSLTSQPSGSNVTLSDVSASKPTFVPTQEGNYLFTLTVSNSNGSDSDVVTVIATSGNAAPIANAGINQEVATPSNVTLDGSGSSDANGDTLIFQWTLLKEPIESSITLSNANAVNPNFSANVDGLYRFSLTVNDGTVTSAQDIVEITASTTNIAPIANAGSNQNVPTGSLVNLDGGLSSDPNGDVITYQWSLTPPAGSSTTLTASTTQMPNFTADIAGTYSVQLVVNDGSLNSAPNIITVTASNTNSAPIANAGPDGTTYQNEAFTLDGSGSSDADGDSLSYQWSVISGEGGSFSSTTAQSPTFTPTNSGSYLIQLIVNDGTTNSLADNMTLTSIEVQLLKKTGQTIAYATYDDGYFQVGENENYIVDGETIIDNKTNLTWQNSDPYIIGSKTYSQAQSYCTSLNLNGHNDWRLPTAYELLSTVTKARTRPAINLLFSIDYSDYWTSTQLSDGDYRVIDFDYGINQPENSNSYNEVRCVRGSMAVVNIQKSGDVVIDHTHKLMWQDNASLDKKDFNEALSSCESLNLHGATDWRLPNINELLSVTDFQNTNGIFNSIFEYNEKSDAIWSSTTDTSYTNDALTIMNKKTTIFFSTTYKEPIIEGFDKSDSTFTNRSKYYKCVRSF